MENKIEQEFHIEEFRENIKDLLRNGITINRAGAMSNDFIFPKHIQERLMTYFPDKYLEIFEENRKLLKRNNELEKLFYELNKKLKMFNDNEKRI